MPDRIDYKIGDGWDISFTEWNDIETATDDTVLIQNFVLVAASYTTQLVGSNPSTTDFSRFKRVVENRYRRRPTVDSVQIGNLSVVDNELSFTVRINSTEFSRSIPLSGD